MGKRGVIVAVAVFAVALAVAVSIWRHAPTWDVVVINESSTAIALQYQQSKDNTWHTPVAATRELRPGESLTLPYQPQDRLVINHGPKPLDFRSAFVLTLDASNATVTVREKEGEVAYEVIGGGRISNGRR